MARPSTDRIELVQTHKLSVALRRLKESKPYDDDKWRRSLYHALAIAGVAHSDLAKIRGALELP